MSAGDERPTYGANGYPYPTSTEMLEALGRGTRALRLMAMVLPDDEDVLATAIRQLGFLGLWVSAQEIATNTGRDAQEVLDALLTPGSLG